MTILTAGTDTQHFTPIRGGSQVSTASNIAPGMQRGVEMALQGNEISLPEFTPQSEIWITFYIYLTNHTSLVQLLNVYRDGEANAIFRIRTTGSGNRVVRLQMWNGSSYTQIGADFTMFIFNSLVRYDIRLNISNTGNVEIHQNGIKIFDFSGDTLLSAITDVDRVAWDGINPSTASTCTISHCLVSDTDSRRIEMEDLRATGAGNYTEMTGSVTDIDELGDPDANFLIAPSANLRNSFTKTSMNSLYNSGWSVSLGVCASAFTVPGGPQNLSLLTRSGSTDGNSANQALDAVNTAVFAQFENDPNTAAAWTFANADAAEFGVESES